MLEGQDLFFSDAIWKHFSKQCYWRVNDTRQVWYLDIRSAPTCWSKAEVVLLDEWFKRLGFMLQHRRTHGPTKTDEFRISPSKGLLERVCVLDIVQLSCFAKVVECWRQEIRPHCYRKEQPRQHEPPILSHSLRSLPMLVFEILFSYLRIVYEYEFSVWALVRVLVTK